MEARVTSDFLSDVRAVDRRCDDARYAGFPTSSAAQARCPRPSLATRARSTSLGPRRGLRSPAGSQRTKANISLAYVVNINL